MTERLESPSIANFTLQSFNVDRQLLLNIVLFSVMQGPLWPIYKALIRTCFHRIISNYTFNRWFKNFNAEKYYLKIGLNEEIFKLY